MAPLNLLAHVGEDHQTLAEGIAHTGETNPLLIGSVVILVAITLPALLYIVTKKSKLSFGVALAELFLIGITLYSALPVLSITSLTVGFGLVLALVLTGLSKAS